MQLGHFPSPYPDELLYSVCARFSDRVAYSNVKAVLEELFGARTATATVALPDRISHLAAALPAGSTLTVDRLIENHTLFPFFSSFVPPERANRLRADMMNDNGQAAYMRSGIMANRIPMPDYLRYCPGCVKDDQRQFSETYWHRLHQLPGVEVCTSHNVLLENSEVSLRAKRQHLLFVSADQGIRPTPVRRIAPTNEKDRIPLKIACEAAWLLMHPNLGTDLQALYIRYLRLLIGHGLATYTGSIHVEKLFHQFKRFYSPALLKLLRCEFTGSDHVKTNWLLRLVRPPKHSQSPLYHLLLMQFLGCTVKEFFQLPGEMDFFGKGPWPCLNPAANHFKEPIIQKQTSAPRLRDNHPIARFTCECGFAYARSGPDTTSEDKFRIGKMISFGPVWEVKLKELWKDSSLSLSEIGQRLGVDPLTVRRHAAQMKLPFSRSEGRSKPFKHATRLKSGIATGEKKLHTCRSKWLSVMKQKSKITLKSLRKALPKVYAWLLQNDSEWLKRNCPKSLKHKKVNSSVDWKSRDAQHAVLVKQSAARIGNAPGRPVRITKTAIGRDLGVISLFQKHLCKMPLTCQMLVSTVESSEGFAIRRIWWAADRYLEEGVCPQRWQLIRRANVYRHREAHGVRDAIQAAMKKPDSEGLLLGAATA